MKILKSPRVMMVIAMTAFGTLGPFVRHIPVSSGELALYRAVLAALLLSGYLMVTKQPLKPRVLGKDLLLLLLSGMAMGINWILLFEAYRYTSVSAATLSYYFAPVLVTVVCPILFREKMSLKQWLCSAMATCGIVMITGIGDWQPGGSYLKGVLFGLGAAVFYATVILLNKFIKGVAGIRRTVLQFYAAILILIPYVAFSGGVTLWGMESLGWVCLLLVGLVHTGVTYCLYFSALKELPGQEVAILSYIDPLVAVLLSVFVLGERMTPVQIVGGSLILGFTLWNELT